MQKWKTYFHLWCHGHTHSIRPLQCRFKIQPSGSSLSRWNSKRMGVKARIQWKYVPTLQRLCALSILFPDFSFFSFFYSFFFSSFSFFSFFSSFSFVGAYLQSFSGHSLHNQNQPKRPKTTKNHQNPPESWPNLTFLTMPRILTNNLPNGPFLQKGLWLYSLFYKAFLERSFKKAFLWR